MKLSKSPAHLPLETSNRIGLESQCDVGEESLIQFCFCLFCIERLI